MFRKLLICAPLVLSAGAIAAEETPAKAVVAKVDTKTSEATTQRDAAKRKEAKAETGTKTLLGISILGNQEAPKALVIVPWKSSQLGDTLGISKNLDDSRQPVDKDVFMRELAYYEIRANSQ